MIDPSNQKSKPVVVFLIIILVLAVLVGAWYGFMYKPEQEAKEKARLEQVARKKAEEEKKKKAAQNKAKYEKLIASADEAFEAEQWETAQSLYTKASAILSKETYPKDQLALISAKLQELAAQEERRAAGEIESVTTPTQRFYVIVSSCVDDDLALDYAKKLSKEGENVKLVEHNFNELPFFGVSLADYGTRDQAEVASESLTGYGDEVWVLKY
ncbi:hypothetical protein [Reichenbachiella ulvae]|uniref:SPOR domain-containing protein n=1 Tax=Reichenbachiella ulvae TaxID=2980104 RepID=A0ABT3CR42_9BACT|nr:hypothetical protein [Reichenbachiella ulvae]MCV9385950.1 hypothetical protein [Reichenbachiella ulvae]